MTNKTKISQNPDELILAKNIDSIFIASPASTHKDYIIKSLLNNKNVFVEKPLCLNITELNEIHDFFNKQTLLIFHY